MIEGKGLDFGIRNPELYEQTHLAFFKALETHEKSGKLSPLIERSALWKNMRLDNMLKVLQFESFKLERYLKAQNVKCYQDMKEKKIEVSKSLDIAEFARNLEAALHLTKNDDQKNLLNY